MTERYYVQLRRWELEGRGGGTEKYAKYVTRKGHRITVRRPTGLTARQQFVELKGLARQHGFEPPDPADFSD